ncbi:MAG: O-antigen ligase family protein [Nitrospirota bacterium]
MTKTRLTILQEISLFCVFLTIPLFRLGTTLLGSKTLTPAKILVVVTFLLWITNILINRNGKSISTMLREKANILILLFLAFTFISLINVRYFRDETIAEIFSRIKMLLLYFVIVGIVRDRQTLKRAILAFIIGSLLTTAVGLYEISTGKAFFKETYRLSIATPKKVEGLHGQTVYGGPGRVQALYSDAGFHAHAMVIFFGLALPWLFYGASKKIKIFSGVLLICYLINLIGTGARVGWVSLGAALFVSMFFLKHRHKYTLWAISLISIVIIFLALSLNPHVPTLERLSTDRSIALQWRLDTNRLALEMIHDHPVLGVGTGNYLTEYHNYLSMWPKLSRYYYGPLHNSYLQIWAENGTIGLLIFLSFLLIVFIGLLKAYLNAVDREVKILALGLLTAFTGYAVEFTGIPALSQELGWTIFGLSVALITIIRKEKEESQFEDVISGNNSLPGKYYKGYRQFQSLGKELSKESLLDIEDADQFISQGRYAEAMDVYVRRLSIEPDNILVLQRMKELKALRELLGKDSGE